MGAFSAFDGQAADSAQHALTSAYNDAYLDAIPLIQQGSSYLTSNYAPGQAAFSNNLSGANAGTTQLGDLLGLNGASGNASALNTLQNTPGYQFALTQGAQNVLRNGAATGTLASGATLNALQNQGQGQAEQTYQQTLQNLLPYLGYSTQSATGVGNLGSSLGQQLNQNQLNRTGLEWQSALGVGNAIANGTLGAANGAAQGLGLGASLLGSLFGGAGGGASGILGGLTGGVSPSNLLSYYTTPGPI